MLENVVLGFVIPWVTVGMFLYRKDKKIVFFIVPFSSSISYSVDAIGFNFGFWHLSPHKYDNLSSLPTDLGYFALLGGLMVYTVRKYKINNFFMLLIFSIVTTVIEFMFVLIGKITYGNGWNISWTFLSYAIPYIIVYYYYILLKRYNLIE